MPDENESTAVADRVQPVTEVERRYAERLNRYTTAMRNEKPDRVPIRPFVAEFTGKHTGYNCQQLTHDYELAFEAARKCALDYEWDAVVANMVYVWTGLTQAIGLRYYGIPGIDVPADTGFQYREPPEGEAFMRSDEYDELIKDPTAFLYNVWLPRVSTAVSPMGEETSYANNLSFVKGAMAMLKYFGGFGVQNGRLRSECGTVSAIAGILKAPMDIIADKLRGYIGLLDDLREQPEKVLAACEALAPHLAKIACTTADPDGNVPVGFWMHRGCVPFVSPDQFTNVYWPTLKPVIQEIWAHGHQTLFYAEGDWNHHLESFAELPDRSIVYHVDQADIFEVHRALGDKFCLSGGISNVLLAFCPAEEVRQRCKEVIEGVARDGGYIMDASAIIQNDAKVENVRAMTEATLEYGVYSQGSTTPIEIQPIEIQPIEIQGAPKPLPEDARPGHFIPPTGNGDVPPGACVPWSEQRQRLPDISGDQAICQRVWEDIDALGNMYIWQCLLSF
jgi:hypothetical protein